MSNTPESVRRSRRAARAAIFLATMFASISASTVVVGSDPVEEATPLQVVTAPVETPEPQATRVAQRAPRDPCDGILSEPCTDPLESAETPSDHIDACSTGGEHDPHGTLATIAGDDGESEAPDVVTVRFEIEDGLAIDGECFATEVMEVLTDSRGWMGVDNIAFARAGDGPADLRVILASPATTDSLCLPARTAGRFSCRKGDRVILNVARWETGTDDYLTELSTYRTYLINHEVGHFLGRGHIGCPAVAEPAPVMMQQTKGLGECLPNGWPTAGER